MQGHVDTGIKKTLVKIDIFMSVLVLGNYATKMRSVKVLDSNVNLD